MVATLWAWVGSRSSIWVRRTTGTASRSRPSCLPLSSRSERSEGARVEVVQSFQLFSGIQFQHELAHLGPQLLHLSIATVDLVHRLRLQATLASLQEGLHPALDLGLLEVVLSADVNEFPLALDQRQKELNLPLRRPSLNRRFHALLPWTRPLWPVQLRRGTTSARPCRKRSRLG